MTKEQGHKGTWWWGGKNIFQCFCVHSQRTHFFLQFKHK